MIVTAPGKVLLLGGYAVLEGHQALSIALLDEKGMGATASASGSDAHRLVSREFSIDRRIDPRSLLRDIAGAGKAEAIAVSAYCVALSYLKETGRALKPVTVELENSPIFGGKEDKSGLGSSAAATVALVGALMESAGMDIEKERETMHRLSQISHAIATGKSGSGFDIATSAYGSILYRRFSAGCIDIDLGRLDEEGFGREVARVAAKSWPGLEIKPRKLDGFDMAAFNIRGAKTSTISAVRAMRRLTEYTPEIYSIQIGKQAAAEAMVLEGLGKKDEAMVREGMHKAREAQRKMSEWIGRVGMLYFDPIEPKQLTALIERAEELDGVVAGRCPGSGGYDSVAFIVSRRSAGLVDKIRKAGSDLGLKLEYIDAAVSDSGARKLS
jgi:ERG8-type phosphomevalonate kinase